MSVTVCALLISLVSLAGPPVQAQEAGFASLQRRVVELYSEHRNAVVRVKAAFEGEPAATSEPQVTLKYGTGFFISREGHLLANASRVFGADRIWVDLNDISYAAELIGADFATNLALLRVVTLPDDFTHFHLPDSNALPEIGTMVLQISCPLEFEPSPFFGLIAGRESNFFDQVFPTTYIRTNIPAGLGEGGAPVLDLNGNLVGIVIAGLVDVQGSYCLPARAARRIRDDLLFSRDSSELGEVNYGWLGFEATERINEARAREVILTGLTEDAPAGRAGLQEGDQLLRIGSFAIRTIRDVRDALFYARVGQFLDMEVLREDETLTFSVRVESRPADEPFVTPISEANESDETPPQAAEPEETDPTS